MAAVTTPGGGDISGWAERNNAQAARLLNLMDAAKPIQHMSAPTLPHIGGDHPKPQGMFVEFLFGPGSFVWPADSETALANDATRCGSKKSSTEIRLRRPKAYAKQVFNNYWTAGEGAEAAEAAYKADSERPYSNRLKSARSPKATRRSRGQRCRAHEALDGSRKRRRPR